MAALFNDVTTFEVANTVGGENGAETVGDSDAGAVADQTVHRSLDGLLTDGV